MEKWYKRIQTGLDNEDLLYVKGYVNKGTLKYTERINKGGKQYIRNDYCTSSNMELCSLEEIQQYLPEGHVDKIKIMKTLPEEYIVECEVTESNEIEIALYGNKDLNTSRKGWNIIIKNDEGKTNSWSRRWNNIEQSGCKGLPVFTYKEWKELFYKVDDFVLPESYYVVVTKENQTTRSQWRFGNSSNLLREIDKSTGMYNGISKEHNPKNSTKGFGEEITFEQFKIPIIISMCKIPFTHYKFCFFHIILLFYSPEGNVPMP